ncbi:MAG: gliding motility-associated C-terminal domain-containing protein [Bacteroidetes bacterium]|nr:gliding motility-associated C-terminal domain-containing protein [Bacteroidota bacterium]
MVLIDKIQTKLLVLLILCALQLNAVTLFVTNTNDAGAGSFRAVLASANNGDVIKFNIPGPGPYTIKPLTAYSFTKQVTIDGTNGLGKPGIEFDGSLSTSVSGFDLNAIGGSGTVIQGLVMNNFSYNPIPAIDYNATAILITKATDVTVRNCYIGTDITGTTAKPNKHGIWINGSSNNVIGGPNAIDGNLISGNLVRGVWGSAQGGSATNNTVENNKVGININGTALPNITGVEFNLNAKNNLIQHNNVSYNYGDALSFNQGSTGNRIYGNICSYNGEHGVDFLNGDVTNSVVGVDFNGIGEPNQIFNNGAAGVFVSEWFDGNVYNYGAPSKITVRKNSIYCNAVKGIALTEKTGPFTSASGNNGKLPPVIDMTSNEEKTFGTATPGDIVDIYKADNCNACNSGNSQGKTWLSSITVGASGTWSYTNSTPGGAKCYSLLVTATNALGNTSEFSGICTRPSANIRDTATCTSINLSFDVTHPCAVSYLWSTGATTPTLTMNNALPGNYWVELKGSDGVAVRDNFEIKGGAPMLVNLGDDINRCNDPFNPPVVLDPGLSNTFSYSWSTGATSSSISVNKRGQYFVKVTNPTTGCSGFDTVNILPNVIPAAVLQNAQFCEGDSVTLNPGVFSIYKWSTGAATNSIKVKSSGVYWVVVTNGSGCTDSVSCNVTVNPKPVFTLQPADFPVCANDSAQFTISANFALSYQWQSSANGIIFTDIVEAAPYSGTTTTSLVISTVDPLMTNLKFRCIARSATCESISIAAKIIYGANISITDPSAQPVCEGSSVQLTAVANGALSYQWQYSADGVSFKNVDNGGSYSNAQTSVLTINPVSAALNAYQFRAIATGCVNDDTSMTATIALLPNTLITMDPADTALCAGENAAFSVSASNALSYQWYTSSNNGSSFSSVLGATSNFLNVLSVTAAMNSNLYFAVATGTCGKVYSDTALLLVTDPIAVLTAPLTVCPGDSFSLSFSANYPNAQFYLDGVLENSNPVSKSIVDQTFYSLTAKVNGCMSPIVTASVRITPIVVPEVADDISVCAGSEVQLGVTEIDGYTYQWINNDGYSSNIPQPKLVPEKTSTYVVTVKNSVCVYSVSDSIHVTVLDGIKLYYPNAFTPNEDGVNDVFKVMGYGVVDFKATIFDRWGEVIYQWNSLDGGWDGRAKNERQVQVDVYVIKVSAAGVCEDKADISTVTVIR